MTFDVESSEPEITIYAFQDGSLLFASNKKMKRKIFKNGGLPIVNASKRLTTHILQKYAREIQGEWYLAAALDGPFDSVDVFYDLVQKIREDCAQ